MIQCFENTVNIVRTQNCQLLYTERQTWISVINNVRLVMLEMQFGTKTCQQWVSLPSGSSEAGHIANCRVACIWAQHKLCCHGPLKTYSRKHTEFKRQPRIFMLYSLLSVRIARVNENSLKSPSFWIVMHIQVFQRWFNFLNRVMFQITTEIEQIVSWVLHPFQNFTKIRS